MSAFHTLFSDLMRIKTADWISMEKAVSESLEGDHKRITIEVEAAQGHETIFTLFHTGHFSEQFPSKVQALATAIGPFLIKAAPLTLRELTNSDERDQVFFAGPAPESMRLIKLKVQLTRAQEELSAILPRGDGTQTPELAAIRSVAHNLVHALSVTDQMIKGEQSSRGAVALTPPTPQPIPDSVKAIPRASNYLAFDTAWGELVLPYGAQFQFGMDGSILVAARTREDGQADILGSLNLQPLETGPFFRENINAAVTKFVACHPEANFFKIVETVPDMLTMNDRTDDHDAPREAG